MRRVFLRTAAFLCVLIVVFAGAHFLAQGGEPSRAESVLRDPVSVITETALPSVSPSPSSFVRVEWTLPPELTAASAIVADLGTGTTYFELRPRRTWPTASLAKLVSAAVVRDKFSFSEEVTLLSSDLIHGGPSLPPLSASEVYTVEDLLRMMLVSSRNEAADALARQYGRREFVLEMNRKAEEWGMTRSFFEDPSGVSVANQSTAADLKLLLMEMDNRYPEVFEITKRKSIVATERRSGAGKEFPSTSIFAGSPIYLGGKTGFTPEAGGNLASVFSAGGGRVLVIVLGSEDRFGETSLLYQWFTHDFRAGS